jgi:hypothetical protein
VIKLSSVDNVGHRTFAVDRQDAPVGGVDIGAADGEPADRFGHFASFKRARADKARTLYRLANGGVFFDH